MSYLDRPRLTFFGQFTANPSTVNNLPYNYAQPLPYNTDSPSDPGNVAWNPYGEHNFSLDDCPITGIVSDVPIPDPLWQGMVTALPNGAGVLVDLDTEQQLVSEIIGMQLTVTVGPGSVSGTFRPVNFVDLFPRAVGQVPGNNGIYGAAYQSVLTDLTWNEEGSPFLQELKAISPNMLSIRMNLDGHDSVFGSPNFTHGRVAGTIGPYFDGEPLTFTNARFLRPVANVTAPSTLPQLSGPFNYAPAKTNPALGTLVVDLGNALPTLWLTGILPVAWPFDPPLQVATVSFSEATQSWSVDTIIGTFDSSQAAYEQNAFVQELPLPPALGNSIGTTPTGIVLQPGTVAMAENPSGAYANAGRYVFRMNPGDAADVTMWANIFEQPAAGVDIILYPNLGTLSVQAVPGLPIATPADALAYPLRVKTAANGQATFTLTASAPRNPRGAIDGQVYGVGWSWKLDQFPDPNAFLSVRLFDRVPVPDKPTWWEDVYPILVQYSYLYPTMQERIQLDDYDDVVNHASVIIGRLTTPENQATYMPITRELSADKKQILLNWLNDPDHPTGPVPVPPPQGPPLPPEPPTSGSGQ